MPWSGAVRVYAPGRNWPRANGLFSRLGYLHVAVSAANPFGLFPDLRLFAADGQANRAGTRPETVQCSCFDSTLRSLTRVSYQIEKLQCISFDSAQTSVGQIWLQPAASIAWMILRELPAMCSAVSTPVSYAPVSMPMR
jgi:hypothetical protein